MPETVHEQRFRATMESEFKTDPSVATPEMRQTNAIEYLAFQSGQINKKLGKIIEMLEKLSGKS